ncbi:Cupin domain-containing protein [Halomicrobium zhouii]|uniref:Cupin domain-containing protein n=1 Tax=Halomicrobium zhouii TaxID=767519 RepID=A0A1I6KDR5_9EURY|nr:cupin domain-containing protein [Halomicrobium zhouii]SFR89351.1 Cupin domain-containing protein [Halomicrobium zhouii]
MPYHHVDPDDLDSPADYPCDRRSISDAAGLNLLHLARYAIEPGEQLPRTYHYHEQREEAFYVLAGTLHVETPEREFVVEADEVFVAEPGSPHRAFNPVEADGEAVVLGTGSPRTDPALEYDGEDG